MMDKLEIRKAQPALLHFLTNPPESIMKPNKKLFVHYDPGSAIGSPATMTFEEAIKLLQEDTEYIEKMLRVKAIETPVRWPCII